MIDIGSVEVRAEWVSFKRIRPAVVDTGVDIRSQGQAKLFKEFGRVLNCEDEILNDKGVGLGLKAWA